MSVAGTRRQGATAGSEQGRSECHFGRDLEGEAGPGPLPDLKAKRQKALRLEALPTLDTDRIVEEKLSHCPPPVRDLVSRMLKKNPEERPSAKQLLAHPVLLAHAAVRSLAGTAITYALSNLIGAAEQKAKVEERAADQSRVEHQKADINQFQARQSIP